MQLIDASRKKYDAGLRRTSGDRYVTSDPIGLDGGPNTYLYANANSLKYYDPDGQLAFLAALPFIGGSGATAAGGGWLAGLGSTLLGGAVFAGMLTIPGDTPIAPPVMCFDAGGDERDCTAELFDCLASEQDKGNDGWAVCLKEYEDCLKATGG